MNFRNFFLAFTVISALLSCDKEETSVTDNNGPDDVLLKSYTVTYSDEPDYLWTVTYDYDGFYLKSINYSDNEKAEFTYTGDLITRIDYTNHGLTNYIVLKYNSDNQLIKHTYYLPDNEVIRIEFTYNSDNTITEKYYKGTTVSQVLLGTPDILTLDEHGQIITYSDSVSGDWWYKLEYDNKKNPLRNVIGIKWLSYLDLDHASDITGFVNNYVLDSGKSGNEVDTDTYNYVYNDKNYPISVSHTFDGVVTTGTYNY